MSDVNVYAKMAGDIAGISDTLKTMLTVIETRLEEGSLDFDGRKAMANKVETGKVNLHQVSGLKGTVDQALEQAKTLAATQGTGLGQGSSGGGAGQ